MTVSASLVVDVDDLEPETIEKLRAAINAVLAEANFVPDPAAVAGWTAASAAEFDKRLRARHRPVQADSIAASAHAGGHVTRAAVYAIGGYQPDRSLNGFTKPVRGVMKEMVAEGLIPADAAMPLEPVYDPTNQAFQKAQGFTMPAAVAAVFASALTPPSA